MIQPFQTPDQQQAHAEGLLAVRHRPQYAPVNPYLDIEPLRQDLVDAWDDGAFDAGINDIYHNGVLLKQHKPT